MTYPARLAHLVTRKILVSKFLPTYAQAHGLDDEEAGFRLEQALRGPLREHLLENCWAALTAKRRRLDDDGLLERIGTALSERPGRRGTVAKLSEGMSALMVLLDLEAGTATEAVRRVMETPAGRAGAQRGLAEGGAFLARELLRK